VCNAPPTEEQPFSKAAIAIRGEHFNLSQENSDEPAGRVFLEKTLKFHHE
jgi:hypothetical protein